MVMIVTMPMMMNCFCEMVDRPDAFGLIFSRDHCQGFSPSHTFNTSRAGSETAQNVISGFVEKICAVVVATTVRCHQLCNFASFPCGFQLYCNAIIAILSKRKKTYLIFAEILCRAQVDQVFYFRKEWEVVYYNIDLKLEIGTSWCV